MTRLIRSAVVAALAVLALVLGLTTAASSLAGGRAHQLVSPRASGSCPKPSYGPLYYAPGGAKTVALTFDDGPGKTTVRILKILRRDHVPAAFFNIGQNMAARPWLVRRESRQGFLLGNHTWNHPDMAELSRSQQAAEMDQVTAEQRKLTGTVPCVFRPPYGDYDTTTLRLAQHRRMAVWLWSVDTEDWKADGSASAYWVNRIVRLAEEEGGELAHPVVLMHNSPVGNPATALALPRIIRFFRQHHYRFVSLLRSS
ncbi:MAG TPA: polysaccharide deacetylase family protein [Streptosporangiaceae bacterium]|nr:polysaccharide deacetylase family protein [Streptosporangiaceae bacterium]